MPKSDSLNKSVLLLLTTEFVGYHSIRHSLVSMKYIPTSVLDRFHTATGFLIFPLCASTTQYLPVFHICMSVADDLLHINYTRCN